MFDLLSDDHGPILKGVYLFHSPDGKECLYVGKNDSMNFVGRIPAHFALVDGERVAKNHFLQYIREFEESGTLLIAAQSA